MVTGATGKPHLRGEVGLTESRVTIPNVLEKPNGAPVTIAFEGDILQAKSLTLSRVEFSAPPLRLPIKGKMQLGDKFLIDNPTKITLHPKSNRARRMRWLIGGAAVTGLGVYGLVGMDGYGLDRTLVMTAGAMGIPMMLISFYIHDTFSTTLSP